MLVFTIQDKSILEDFNTSGIYYNELDYSKRENWNEGYYTLMDLFEKQHGYLPTFVYRTYNNEEITQGNYRKFYYESLQSYNREGIVLLLDIPEALGVTHRVADWAGFICDIDEGILDEGQFRNFLSRNWFEDNDYLQTLLPYIKAEWLVEVY